MRLSTLPFGLLAFLFACDAVSAVRLPLSGQRKAARAAPNVFSKRASMFGQTILTDDGDVSYMTRITLGGQWYDVIVDTGSSDLWVQGPVPNSLDTGLVSGATYAVGGVRGSLKLADLEFAGYTVQNQTFMDVAPANNAANAPGIIGLGPSSGSANFLVTKYSDSGLPPLDRIFRQNTSTPNYITALLGRAQDPTEPYPGELTIAEVIPGYEAVLEQPKLNMTHVNTSETMEGVQHWQTLLDANGIAVNGQTIEGLTTLVGATNDSAQLTAMFDTGFTYPQVPSFLAQAFYGDIPGAQLANISGLGQLWKVPCDAEINITFTFGGVNIPIHPLDAAIDMQSEEDELFCVGAFQPMTTNTRDEIDMILGMAFLRNAYLLVNLGDFVDNSTASTADGYIQLLSVTNDSSVAHADFLRERATAQAIAAQARTHRRTRAIQFDGMIVGIVLLTFALIAGVVVACRQRRIARAGSGTNKEATSGNLFGRTGPGYSPLEGRAPAPPMYQV